MRHRVIDGSLRREPRGRPRRRDVLRTDADSLREKIAQLTFALRGGDAARDDDASQTVRR